MKKGNQAAPRRIVKDYKRFPDADLTPFAQNVHNRTSVAPPLANPTPTMAVFQAAIDGYSNALTLARDRDRLLVVQKNTARAVLTDVLDELANFVTLFAINGDEEILTMSGFTLNKIPGSVLTETPILVFINGDNPGELITIARDAFGAKTVVHEITPDPLTDASVWTSVSTTVKSYTFKNLPKGQNFWGRVRAIGNNMQEKLSLPASRIVQ